MADLLTLYYERSAKYLETKSHPAYEEAKRIRELRADTRTILQKKKEIEYQLSYIRLLFPNIDDIFEPDFNTNQGLALDSNNDENEIDDPVKNYLSDEEYQKLQLQPIERNQLALDNYLKNRKTKWQIGRDYEMYIGYLYEKDGYKIEYHGIIKKLEDMGRDLIATKDNDILIIQCKNWSKDKEIHEKHIFQLFGTLILYKLSNISMFNIKGVFITSTKLSETAKKVAKELDIEVIENKKMEEFPRIKCNINRTTKKHIYHLPFDQQYDATKIDITKGECYCLTVKEAEEKGFKRALYHKFDKK